MVKKIKVEWPMIVKETRFIPNQVDGQIQGFTITKLPSKVFCPG